MFLLNKNWIAICMWMMIHNGIAFAAPVQHHHSQPYPLAAITPATITPPTVTPSTVTPTQINPPVITAPAITPQTITPSITTPSNTMPAITRPPTIIPSQVNPGNSSSASSTSISIPNPKPSPTAATPVKIPQELPAGMIFKTKGAVNIVKKNKKVYALKEESLFFTDEIITTKNDSYAALRFNDGTLVVLGPDSALEIQHYWFTVPAKGEEYKGSSKDRSVIKLYQGILNARLGSFATFNNSTAFSLLTPRGCIQLTDAKKEPNMRVIYNNKIGLVVNVVGGLNNSKGHVSLNNKSYGLVSAVIGSSPTTTTVAPLAFSEPLFTTTTAWFNAQLAEVNTTYSERIMTQIEHEMLSEPDEIASNDAVNLEHALGDDDGKEAIDEHDEEVGGHE